jgi:glycosyltransferase involved in cell wall biosynthesis
MKIAILCNSLCSYSGVDRVVAWQARELNKTGNQVSIFSFEADMKPPEGVGVQVLGIPRGFLRARIYRLLFPLNILAVKRIVRRLKDFDVVYSHHYPLNWVAYLAKTFHGTKYVYYYHHLNPPGAYPTTIQRTYERLLLFLTKWTAKKADSAISISKYSQKALKEEMGLESEVIYDKIDSNRFHLGLDGSVVRQKHDIRDRPVILFVGAISPHKCVHLLIEAFKLIKHAVPDSRLLLVGKTIFSAYFRQLKQISDDSVTFVDYVSDEELPYYYAACDVYATASLWEGFNIPLVEAQACGKAVVAFNIGPHPEVVKDGETGFLVSPRDINALAQAVIKLLKDDKLRREMGENGSRMVMENFSL